MGRRISAKLPDGTILSPSYNRAKEASVREVLPSCKLVVPESQKSAYEAIHGPENVIAIPDSKDGNCAKKRNACIDLFKDGETFGMVDDDFKGFYHVKTGDPVKCNESVIESVIQLVQNTDIVFGGWNNTNDPMKVADFKPFSLTKQFYGAVVLKRTKLRYSNWRRFSDSDYFLQVVHEYRRVFRDNRYFLKFNDPAGGIGGDEKKHADYSVKLVNKWGTKLVTRLDSGVVKAVRTPLKGP